VLDASEGRDFHVNDGSGALARVPGDAMTVPIATHAADPAHAGGVSRLLSARGIDCSTDGLVWFEQRIEPGASVYVLGEARPPQTPSAGAYRGPSTSERIVVAAPAGGELLVSIGSEAELAGELRGSRAQVVLSWLLMIVLLGLGFGVVGSCFATR
jgi:hypothetical protein